MAYINVKDWSVDQVTDWFKGLDNVIMQYNINFLNNGVTGHQLLNLRADDLEHLGVKSLGHQEIILEAVEQLRYFHFELDKENLQILALKLSCVANSLYKELLLIDDDCSNIHTQVMADVHNVISTIKPLAYWLDRPPFVGDNEYIESKINLLQLGFEMATSAHRGIFSENPIRTIRSICEKLTKIADHIIQEVMDPMILQPASLDLATLKKKEQEIGFFILPTNNFVHQIADIKHGSPAHGTSKIEEGDEIVQVNYQTVVGWQQKKVMMLLQESAPDIVLTLKKRPRHTKVYGQIYMKPYRLPSKKRNDQNWSSRWYDNIPSPRLLTIDLPPITITRVDNKVVEVTDVEIELSSSDSESPDSPLDANRIYPLKPRPILQRRNTITGSTPTNKRPYPSIEQYWNFIKSKNIESNTSNFEEDSQFLRDKSASCTVGLDLSPRPITVIGISRNNSKQDHQKAKRKVNFDVAKKSETEAVSVMSLASLNNEEISFIDEGRELTDRSSMTVQEKEPIKTDVKVHEMIKKFDEKLPKVAPKVPKKPPEIPQKCKPAVPPRKSSISRGKLDKSHSTPAYDLTENDNKSEEKVKMVPPKPPPRNLNAEKFVFPETKETKKEEIIIETVIKETVISTPKEVQVQVKETVIKNLEPKIVPTKPDKSSVIVYEIHKPETKSSPTNSLVKAMIKGKSSKKKNTLIAKRRKVSVTELSPLSEIQGFLYQRLRYKQTQNVHWEKRWFLLSGNCLYGFRSKEGTRAACLIFLSGFTVAVASEVKSRSNAFKVYHTGTVFYFSAEDQDALQSWIDLIRHATLHNNDNKNLLEQDLYTETDDSDDEKSKPAKESFTSLRKNSKKSNDGSTSLDRKWFFNKSGNQSKNSLPVPTSQFRSYRKIPVQSSITTGNFTSHIPTFANQQQNNVSVPNLSVENPKLVVKKPIEQHASNPILSSDFSAFKTNENLAGFVTLEELMIRQTEERKMNPHYIVEEVTKNLHMVTSDVVYGEVPIRPKDVSEAKKIEPEPSSSSCFGKRLGSLKKEKDYVQKTATYPKIAKMQTTKVTRSLPRTHKVQDSEIPEMIYCPETINDIHFAHNMKLQSSKLKKQNSFNSEDKPRLKSTFQYTPMSVPLTDAKSKQPKFAFELNLDENKATSKGNKLKQIFSTSKSSLSSPKLKSKKHKTSTSSTDWISPTQMQSLEFTQNIEISPTPIEPFGSASQVDYPGLEYPPVFEPETYSLANPQSNIIRKQSHK